ncbi:alkaline-phosphatase-like protein [Aspergillus floccosus]
MNLVSLLHASWHRSILPLVRQVQAAPAQTFDRCWDFSRRYFFTLALLSLLGAKILHLYAHLHSLPPAKFLLWGITFFFQDVLAILLLRIATRRWRRPSLALVAAILVVPFSLIMSGMASANISFYIVTGAEIHWRQAKTFHRDAAAVRTLLTGLTGFLIVEAILLSLSSVIARPVHRIAGSVVTTLVWPWRLVINRICHRRPRHPSLPDPETYAQVAEEDYNDDSDLDAPFQPFEWKTKSYPKPEPITKRLTILLPFIALFILRALRPSDPSYLFLSGALPLVPFVDARHRLSPVDTAGLPGDYRFLDGRTALNAPPPFSWLPPTPLPGFEDWDAANPLPLHYDPAKDPLHLANLDQPVLEPIRQALADGSVRIKHVILLKLESTRADVFPLRNDSFIWNKIVDSYPNRNVPLEVEQRVRNLTRTAEYLTGFSTGFDHRDNLFNGKKAYGGISASNAVTTGTYTLKSLVGTVCGVTPLVADFNREYNHHIYQPCMPHVLDAVNQQPDITTNTEDFAHWPWHSMWMQSVTHGYDNQDKLTPVLGFHDVQTKESIRDRHAKHYPPLTKEVNYYGYADTELREYLRDAIDDAERNHTRLFLTHLTGTTHHPWRLPGDKVQQIMSPSWASKNKNVNRYLNTIHFIDDWLAEILSILEEKGIADETLIAMAGDHGLSLPNDGGSTPYDNPHIGSFQVPIVLAHPRLPPVEITTPVISDQILPTILDLLIESSSLSPNGTTVAKDVRGLYEGQSMIRPLTQEAGNIQDWQFTVMNTGGSWLAVRSAARPGYRLVVPLIDDLEWRFTNIALDPHELQPVTDFNLVDLAKTLDAEYGVDAVNWLRDAAHIAEWWVRENWRRYGYTPPGMKSQNMTQGIA